MTVLERKTFLKKQIDFSDETLLEKFEKIIQNEKITLPKFVLKDLETAKNQMQNGDFFEEEEAEKDFEEWLQEG